MTKRTTALLGAYVLPGPEMNPLEIVKQTKAAEDLGLGSVWLSELQGPFKDAGALCGYMGAATSTIAFGTSITHFSTRHPMVLASWGATMALMSNNRFKFGFGRSSAGRWQDWGVPKQTLQSMADQADILRRLWNHEKVSYSGPAGEFPDLDWGYFPDFTPPPLMLAAMGPKTLRLGGSHFDAVFLMPFLTPDGVARSVAYVREGAEQAGKDPDSVVVYHELVVAPDMTDEQRDIVVRARASAYYTVPGNGELLLEFNGWDTTLLAPFRQAVSDVAERNRAAGSPLVGRQLYVEASHTLPDHYFTDGAAIGTASQCAGRIHDFLDAGADEVILHGATPDHLRPTVSAFGPVV
jgi:5,10-methylenetetrahydromethanopterin reductase